jgi:hypothetical protein
MLKRFNELLTELAPGDDHERAVKIGIEMMERVAKLEEMVERFAPENSGRASPSEIEDIPENRWRAIGVGIRALHEANYTIGVMMAHLPVSEERVHAKAYRTMSLLDKAIQELITIRYGIEKSGVTPDQGRNHERDRTDPL